MDFQRYQKFPNQVIEDQKFTCITPYIYKMDPGRLVVVAVWWLIMLLLLMLSYSKDKQAKPILIYL